MHNQAKGPGGCTRRRESKSLSGYGGAKTKQKKKKLLLQYIKAILNSGQSEDERSRGRMQTRCENEVAAAVHISALNPGVTL